MAWSVDGQGVVRRQRQAGHTDRQGQRRSAERQGRSSGRRPGGRDPDQQRREQPVALLAGRERLRLLYRYSAHRGGMSMSQPAIKQVLFDPIFNNYPFGLQILGICSALAVTSNLKTALVMSIALTLVTGFSNLFISMIRSQIPS